MWATETVSTYVYKRAFNWNTFDLGYPSAIAVVWFVVVIGFVLFFNRVFKQKERLEY
jgi:multiple sugar transport system permease protein/raffinose/stachyose/melibiose transport system permease protein